MPLERCEGRVLSGGAAAKLAQHQRAVLGIWDGSMYGTNTFRPGARRSKVITEGRLINASDYSESALQRLHVQLNSQNGADVRRKSSRFFSIAKEHRYNSHWRADFHGHPTVRKAQRHHQQCAAEN